jgi:hypothetical protein
VAADSDGTKPERTPFSRTRQAGTHRLTIVALTVSVLAVCLGFIVEHLRWAARVDLVVQAAASVGLQPTSGTGAREPPALLVPRPYVDV